MDLSALESCIKALEASLGALRPWLVFWNVIVVVGLVVEYHPDIKELVFGRPRTRRKRWPVLVGGGLIVIGISGEISNEFKSFNIENSISKKSLELETLLEKKAGNAQTSADKAANAADRATASAEKAEGSTSKALALARGARKEADSFEKDIVSAKNQAAEAESHLAEALRDAAEATAELSRLKSPRSLTNVPKLISTLAAFKGTEYAFSGVFGDGESVSFLQSIDGVLQSAGWKRTVSPPASGVQLLVKLPSSDVPSAIPSFIADGIRISVQFSGEFSVLQSTPIESLPMYMRAGQLLYRVLSSSISPVEEHLALVGVDVDKGESKTVFISIGKKP